MFYHDKLGKSSFETTRKLYSLLKTRKIVFGGNMQLKIYGTLYCKSGKRMKIKNRIFFISEKEAIANGYRPCGHCMKEKYLIWKNNPALYPDCQTSP